MRGPDGRELEGRLRLQGRGLQRPNLRRLQLVPLELLAVGQQLLTLELQLGEGALPW